MHKYSIHDSQRVYDNLLKTKIKPDPISDRAFVLLEILRLAIRDVSIWMMAMAFFALVILMCV